MIRENKVFNNSYLTRSVLEFSNCKDLAIASQISKSFHFSSLSIQDPWKNLAISLFDNYRFDERPNLPKDYHTIVSNATNWKKVMKEGVLIRNGWDKFQFIENLICDEILQTKKEVFSIFKEFYYCGELRKANFVLENDLNSPFQTFLFDERENEFRRENIVNDEMDSVFLLRNDIPFHDLITNFKVYEKDVIQWSYYYDHMQAGGDISDSELSNIGNPAIFVNLCFYRTARFYCDYYSNYLKEFQNNDSTFLNEYIKYHSHFMDCAMYFEGYLENVIITLRKIDLLNTQSEYKRRRLSIVELMTNLWRRFVLSPLFENISKSFANILSSFSKRISSEIEQVSPKFNQFDVRQPSNYSIDLDFLCSNAKVDNQMLGSSLKSFTTAASTQDSEFTFSEDYQNNYNEEFLIEHLFKSMIDLNVTVSNISSLNLTTFKVCNQTKALERLLNNSIEELVVKSRNSLIIMLSVLESALLHRQLPRLRRKIINTIEKNVSQVLMGDILIMFQNHLSASKEMLNNQSHNSIYQTSNDDDLENLRSILIPIAQLRFQNSDNAVLITDSFISCSQKEKTPVKIWLETKKWASLLKEEDLERDRMVEKAKLKRGDM